MVSDLGPQADVAGSRITLQAGERLCGHWDDFRVEQIIINLLTNALRYGARKPVDVGLTCESGQAVVTVRDHGEGIALEDQQRIFAPFERVGMNTVREGLGLGLTIARQLAEAHGGTLEVTSTVGEGAVFVLRLPLEANDVRVSGVDR